MNSIENTASQEASVNTTAQETAATTPVAPSAESGTSHKGHVDLVVMANGNDTTTVASIVFPTSTEQAQQTPLNDDEQVALRDHEAIIKQNLAAFIEVGKALYQIQSRRLYRMQYSSFDEYVQSRWGFKRAHAYRYIKASLAVSDMSPIGDTPLPANEAQARVLAGMTPEQKIQTMNQAKVLAGNDKPTAAQIAQAAKDLGFKKQRRKAQDTEGGEGGQPVGDTPPTPPPSPTPGEAQRAEGQEAIRGVLQTLREGLTKVQVEKSYEAALTLLNAIEAELTKLLPAPAFTNLVVTEVVGTEKAEEYVDAMAVTQGMEVAA